jgi:hypothetical protein
VGGREKGDEEEEEEEEKERKASGSMIYVFYLSVYFFNFLLREGISQLHGLPRISAAIHAPIVYETVKVK